MPFSITRPSQEWEDIIGLSNLNKSWKGATIREFLDLVEKDFLHRNERSLERDFAHKLSRTTSLNNLGKICRQIIHLSPSGCIKARLMTEACKLLSNPKLSVGQIAEKLGFEDPTYFTRRFKKHYGKSPLSARKLFEIN